MGKEIFASIILLGLLAGTFYNSWYFEGFIDDIVAEVNISESYSQAGEADKAISSLYNGIDNWNRKSLYVCSLFSQTHIDRVTDSFHALLGDLLAEEFDRSASSYDELRSNLKTMATMESVRLSSIF